MNSAGFRRISLGMFEATEGSHMGHADFRVGGRVFATLPPPTRNEPRVAIGMVKLSPATQAALMKEYPAAFYPAPGAWGRQGCTFVRLANVTAAVLRPAIHAAWLGAAPKPMLRQFQFGDDPQGSRTSARAAKTRESRRK